MNIDNLEIAIKAQANTAIKSLDSLEKKLLMVSNSIGNIKSGGLNTMASGVTTLADAVNKIKGIDSRSFTALAKNIDKLSNVNSAGLINSANAISSMSTALSSLNGMGANIANLDSLSNAIRHLGYKSVDAAINNMPRLATAMNELMASLSKAPTVSNNLIQMTNALAKLTASGYKFNSSSGSINKGFKLLSSGASSTQRSFKSLAYYFGKFYASYFLFVRGIKKIGSSIKKSMDFIEVENYFNAAIKQVVQKSDTSLFRELGYRSAQEYTDAFSAELQNLFSKMSGFEIGENGQLFKLDEKSLGIDPAVLMNYEAQFAQMASSMGVASEYSIKLSRALTEIGADLSSVKNIEFENTWESLASALTGTARAADKFGVNLRVSGLQQELLNLGLDLNVQKLNQADKALLRTITLLDNSRFAWGDLSNTLSQPANQFRMLQSGVSNLARTLGNLFLPMVAKVIPYVNMLINALQRLAEFLVKMFGLEGFEWGGTGGPGDAMSDLLDQTEQESNALGTASDNAKKLKKNLLGIDELNVLSDSSNNDNGVGSAIESSNLLQEALDKILEEYQAAWDEAFENMENRANTFADNVKKAFEENGLYGVGRYFADSLTEAMNKIPWDSIYEKASNFGKGLAEFLNGTITPEKFAATGKTIANVLNTAVKSALSFGEEFDFENWGTSIGSALNSFFDNYDFDALAETLNTWVDGLEDAVSAAVKEFDTTKALGKIKDFLGELEIDTISVIIGAILIKRIIKTKIASGVISGIGSQISKKIGASVGEQLLKVGGLSNLLTLDMAALIGETGWYTAGLLAGGAIIGGISAAFVGWNLGQLLYEQITGEEIEKSFNEQMSEILESFTDGSWKGALDLWGKDIVDGCKLLGDQINEAMGPLGEFTFSNIGEELSKTWNDDIEPWFNKDKWSAELDNINSAISDTWDDIQKWWDSSVVNKFWKERIEPKFTKDYWTQKFDTVQQGAKAKWEEIKKWYTDNIYKKFWQDKIQKVFTKNYWVEKFDAMKKGAIEKWDDIKKWWDDTVVGKFWNETISPIFTKEFWLEKWQGFKDGIVEMWDSAIEALKLKWNEFANWMNDKLTFKIDTSTLIGEGISKVLGSDTIKLASIPTFATGGFPSEDGVFMANHNELIGTFSNGQTAVVNNGQIIAGIANGVKEAVREDLSPYLDKLVTSNDVIARKDLSVNIGDRDIARANLRGSKQMGARLVTT